MERPDHPVIEFADVSKSYGAVRAVNGISFSAKAGETVAVLGPSGCGKTTTLRMIAGFEEPDGGTILIGGENMAGRRPYERNVGLLFQSYALFPHMSVRKNIAYGLSHRHWPRGEIGARVDEMLELVKLSGYGDRMPRQLSGGQQQRVALARVLATRPRLVLLDEPLSALDAKLREELGTELKSILTSVGSTTIVVTHDQTEAMTLADRIIVMNAGRIDQIGSPDEIYARPRSRFVANFVGRSNWLAGTALAPQGRDGGLVRLKDGTILNAGAGGLAEGNPVVVGLRPERIMLADGHAGIGPGTEVCLSGTVKNRLPIGPETHYDIACAAGRLMVVCPNDGRAVFSPGDTVRVGFAGDNCTVFPATSENDTAAKKEPI